MTEEPEKLIPTAADLRRQLMEKKAQRASKKAIAELEEEEQQRIFAEDFMRNHIGEEEFAVMNRSIIRAMEDEKTEALVYKFHSDLCADSGRAISNTDPDWPTTLQGKALEVYEAFVEQAKPAGYKLKAMIVDFPDGKPGNVGIYLSWK